MKKRRVISLLLVFAMMFSLCATVFADDSDEETSVRVTDFKDISESDWFYEDVKYCIEGSGYTLFQGTSDDTFSPYAKVTRAMFVTVLGRYGIAAQLYADQDYTSFCNFTDVSSGAYYENYCGWAVQRKITDGTGNNKFNPNATITREDAMTMIGRYLYASGIELKENHSDSYVESFKDADQISSYAYDYIEELRKASIITGDDGYLRPKATITRAEMATIMSRLVQLLKRPENYTTVEHVIQRINGLYYDVSYHGHTVDLSEDEKLNVLRYVASKIGMTSYATFEGAYEAELQLIRDCVDYDGDPQKTYANLGTYWDTMSNSTTHTYTDEEILNNFYLTNAYKHIFTMGWSYIRHRLYGSVDAYDKKNSGFTGTWDEFVNTKIDAKLGAGHSDKQNHVTMQENIYVYYVGTSPWPDTVALDMNYYFCGETFMDS